MGDKEMMNILQAVSREKKIERAMAALERAENRLLRLGCRIHRVVTESGPRVYFHTRVAMSETEGADEALRDACEEIGRNSPR